MISKSQYTLNPRKEERKLSVVPSIDKNIILPMTSNSARGNMLRLHIASIPSLPKATRRQ